MKLRELERRLAEEPDNLGLRVAVAGAMRAAGRQAEAVELYRSVAIAYRDQGRTQQAVAVCRSILEIAPQDPRCLTLLAALDAPEDAPSRRSSFDETPLPRAMPHHIHDPTTSSLEKLSASDLLAAIDDSDPHATAPIPRIDLDDEEDDAILTPPAFGDEDERTSPRDMFARRAGAVTRGPIGGAFFAPLPGDRRASVLARFQTRVVAPGATVIRQHEANHPLVIVVRGRLDVRAERADGQIVQLASLGAGEYFGEAALLARTPSAAAVIAATEAELLLLPPRDFYEIAGAYPALWAELKDVAERRMREHDQRLRKR